MNIGQVVADLESGRDRLDQVIAALGKISSSTGGWPGLSALRRSKLLRVPHPSLLCLGGDFFEPPHPGEPPGTCPSGVSSCAVLRRITQEIS